MEISGRRNNVGIIIGNLRRRVIIRVVMLGNMGIRVIMMIRSTLMINVR